jgi:hypothetical protein
VLWVLLAACWAVVPAFVCERRVRALGGGRVWGAALGVVFGPLGVAAVNVYGTLLYRALIAAHLPRRAPHAPPEHRAWQPAPPRFVFSARADLLALACLWAAAFLAGALYNSGPAEQTAATNAGRAPRRTQATAPAAAPTADTPTAPLSTERNPPQTFERPAGNAPSAAEPGRLSVLGAAAATAAGSPENAPVADATAQTTATVQPVGVGPTPTVNAATPTPEPTASVKPAASAGGASAPELVRLVLPPGLKAHGTISGAGSTTTLAITCADCAYEQAGERLHAAGVRAALKAAGIRVVVVVSRQDSWTFIL